MNAQKTGRIVGPENIVKHYENLSEEAVRAIRHAYRLGRADALEELGIDEDDLPSGDGMIAWAV